MTEPTPLLSEDEVHRLALGFIAAFTRPDGHSSLIDDSMAIGLVNAVAEVVDAVASRHFADALPDLSTLMPERPTPPDDEPS